MSNTTEEAQRLVIWIKEGVRVYGLDLVLHKKADAKALHAAIDKLAALASKQADGGLNLNCKSEQKRLATPWGFLPQDGGTAGAVGQMPLPVALRLLASQIKENDGLRDNRGLHHRMLEKAASALATPQAAPQPEVKLTFEQWVTTQDFESTHPHDSAEAAWNAARYST